MNLEELFLNFKEHDTRQDKFKSVNEKKYRRGDWCPNVRFKHLNLKYDEVCMFDSDCDKCWERSSELLYSKEVNKNDNR